MAHDVFISYSSEDKPIADAVCASLEQSSIRCWVAPRDILPSQSYGEAIIEAISNAKLMVLVFSSTSNSSPQVLREVERAVSKEIPIVPFRIAEVSPTKSMEYFLSAPHWLDAITPPMEKHVRRLGEVVRSIVATSEETSFKNKSDETTESKRRIEPNCNSLASKSKLRIVYFAAALLLISTLASVAFWRNLGNPTVAGSTTGAMAQSDESLIVRKGNKDDLQSAVVSLLVVKRLHLSEHQFVELIHSSSSAFQVSPFGHLLSVASFREGDSSAWVHTLGEDHIVDWGLHVTRTIGDREIEFTNQFYRLYVFDGSDCIDADLQYYDRSTGVMIVRCDRPKNRRYFPLANDVSAMRGKAIRAMYWDIEFNKFQWDRLQQHDSGLPVQSYAGDLIKQKQFLVTEGTILGSDRDGGNSGVLFHSASVSTGSLSAPIVDEEGTVVGINIGTKTDSGMRIGIGLSTAQIRAVITPNIDGVLWR